ncbi:MAG: DUF2341 domain-containing protein, partial [Bacteroidetes bacterium]|nr:DUF2341 domain-containing protein [Bacteroidota bacterium]
MNKIFSKFSLLITIGLLSILFSTDYTFAQNPGNALDFDGSNDYISVPDATALDITDQITIEAWFKPSSSSWAYKKLITIDYTKVSATLTDFPVLVSVTDVDLKDSDNGGPIQPDGDDILFLKTDGTKLSHEIEKYDGSTGQLAAWVKIPSLSSSTDTEFYLYYGNSSCSSQQDAANVWDSNYKGVWHMNDSPGGPIIFQDGFEGSGAAWDDKWENNGVTSWSQASDQVQAGSFSAKATNGSEGVFTSNDIDASSATSLTVDFWFRKDATETTDFTLFYFDGTSYDLIVELDSQGADDTWLHYSAVVTDIQYLISNFRIRFDATLANNENVWVDELQVIDGPVAGSLTDSTPNGNTGVKSGPVEDTGKIDNGQSFDGVDDVIDAGNDPSLDITSTITVSMWSKSNSNPPDWDPWLIKSTETSWSDGYGIYYYNGSVWFFVNDFNGPVAGQSITPTNWNYIVGTYDGSNVRMYVNKVEGTPDAFTGSITSTTGTLEIGRGKGDDFTIAAIIDEVRISSVARDSSWIGTEYRNQNSPGTFMSFSNQTAAGVSKSGAYGISTNNSKAYGTINNQSVSGSITAGEWNHISLTYDKDAGGTDEIKLYLNGTQSATGDYATAISTNNNNLLLGDMVGFLGKMDEIRLWNDVRTQQEIRENMHRIVTPGSETNLVAYWKLNESSGTSAADSKGSNTGTLFNMTDGDWVASTAPFGGGIVNSTTSFTSGTANLGTFSLTTTDAFDNPVDITSTEILNAPNILPSIANPLDDRYWVVDVFGTPGTYTANLTFTLPSGYLDLGDEANLNLYNRSSNSDGSWTTLVSGATSMTATTVTFNGVSTLG